MSLEETEPVQVQTDKKSKKRKSEKTPEERAAKKAKKEAKKLAKVQTAENPPSIDATAIQTFLKDNAISYEPADAPLEIPPVLAFDQLPLDDALRGGLSAFKKPTPIQSSSFGVLLKGRDTVAIAETGSGKTIAFGLPAIKHLQGLPVDGEKKKKKRKRGPVSVLVLAPTRELAMQTHEALQDLSTACGFTAVCVYGGVPKPPQVEAINNGARIVVGTPGRIIDLCNDETLDLGQVSYLVLDEADRMLDKGFENDIRTIISKTRTNKPTDDTVARQTAMFSATWPASVRRLAADFMKDPIKITVGSDDLTASASVHQTVMVLEDTRMKEQKLLSVLRDNGWTKQNTKQSDKVLVFALYKKEASRIEAFLRRNGYSVTCLQGDMSQAARTQSLSDFKAGKSQILVATDVAARGLDIPKVELVINQTFPLTIEDYIHRIGRTGRAGRKGKAITFFTAEDKAHAGELQRVLREGGMEIPEALKSFGGTIKKKTHAIYGDHYDESLAGKKGTKIVFD